jgi:hypothetical protein
MRGVVIPRIQYIHAFVWEIGNERLAGLGWRFSWTKVAYTCWAKLSWRLDGWKGGKQYLICLRWRLGWMRDGMGWAAYTIACFIGWCFVLVRMDCVEPRKREIVSGKRYCRL